MKIDSKLGPVDRVGSVLLGLVAMAYGSLGEHDHTAYRGVLIALGVIFVIGGVGGT